MRKQELAHNNVRKKLYLSAFFLLQIINWMQSRLHGKTENRSFDGAAAVSSSRGNYLTAIAACVITDHPTGVLAVLNVRAFPAQAPVSTKPKEPFMNRRQRRSISTPSNGLRAASSLSAHSATTSRLQHSRRRTCRSSPWRR